MKYHFKCLFLEPYRLFFLGASLDALFSLSLWHFHWHHILSGSQSLNFSYPPGLFHLFSMLFGALGFYIAGFLLTAFPKWMGSSPFTRREFSFLFLLQASSQIIGMSGFFYHPLLVKIGFSLAGLFQVFLLGYLLQKFYSSQTRGMQPCFVLIAIGFSVLSALFTILYLFNTQQYNYYILSFQIGVFLYVLLLILSVTFRIVPFFSSRVLPSNTFKVQKNFLPISFILILLFLLSESSLIQIAIPIKVIISGLLLGFIAKQWLAWKPLQTIRTPLLFVIHICWFWILVYFVLHILLLLLLPQNSMMQIACIHTLLIGCDLSLVLAISTRVTRGHGGHPLILDWPGALAFFLLQISALTRIIFPWLATHNPHFSIYTHSSALFGALAFIVWGIRYWPWLFSSKQ